MVVIVYHGLAVGGGGSLLLVMVYLEYFLVSTLH